MNPFFVRLAQELQAHAQPATPDSSHPPAQLCPSAAPGSKTYRIDDIAAILDISRAGSVCAGQKAEFSFHSRRSLHSCSSCVF